MFLQKLDTLLDLIVNQAALGDVLAFEYYHHVQARGLPHAHILIKLVSPLTRLDCVDALVQAEIPCSVVCPVLHAAVTKHMMHAPCASNPLASCRKTHYNRCKYRFPKPHQPITAVSANGSLHYRRRGEHENVQRGHSCTDAYVYPYNARLLLMIDSHVSVLMAMRSNVLARYFYKSCLTLGSSKAHQFVRCSIIAAREASD